jgi:hypothetical protein
MTLSALHLETMRSRPETLRVIQIRRRFDSSRMAAYGRTHSLFEQPIHDGGVFRTGRNVVVTGIKECRAAHANADEQQSGPCGHPTDPLPDRGHSSLESRK